MIVTGKVPSRLTVDAGEVPRGHGATVIVLERPAHRSLRAGSEAGRRRTGRRSKNRPRAGPRTTRTARHRGGRADPSTTRSATSRPARPGPEGCALSGRGARRAQSIAAIEATVEARRGPRRPSALGGVRGRRGAPARRAKRSGTKAGWGRGSGSRWPGCARRTRSSRHLRDPRAARRGARALRDAQSDLAEARCRPDPLPASEVVFLPRHRGASTTSWSSAQPRRGARHGRTGADLQIKAAPPRSTRRC